MSQVPINGYRMFNAENSIAKAVENRYDLTENSLNDFDAVKSAVVANGSITDFDAAYRPATINDIDESDHFRNFPATGVPTCGVRYFAPDVSVPTKENTIVCDLCEHQPDETPATYNCDTDGTPYDGIEGFVTYTITTNDLTASPSGIRIRINIYIGGLFYEWTGERTTTGFFRVDYATGPIYSERATMIVRLEPIGGISSTDRNMYGTLLYDSSFLNDNINSPTLTARYNDNTSDTQYTTSLTINNDSGGSSSITNHTTNIDAGYGQCQVDVYLATVTFDFSFDLEISLYQCSSPGVKGDWISTSSFTHYYHGASGGTRALAIDLPTSSINTTNGGFIEFRFKNLGSVNT